MDNNYTNNQTLTQPKTQQYFRDKIKNIVREIKFIFTQASRTEKTESLILAVVSILGALVTTLTIYFSNAFLLNPVCQSGLLNYTGKCIAGGVVFYLTAFIFGGLVSGAFLRFIKFKHAILITLFSILTLLPTNYLRQGLEYYPLEIITTSLFIYFIIMFQLYYFIFNMLTQRLLWSIMTSVILTLLSMLIVPPVGIFLDDHGFLTKKDAKLATLDFQIYAPAKAMDRFTFDGYDFNYFIDPPHIKINFSPTLTMYLYKTPSYFNPPNNCGLPYPDSFIDNGPSASFACPVATITPRGRPIYAYSSQFQGSTYNPNIVPDTYYTQIGNTVISFEKMHDANTSLQEVADIVDSLHVVSADDLKSLDQTASR